MSKPTPGNSSGPALRRNQACQQCQRGKLKCDAGRPHCGTCVRQWNALIAVPPPVGFSHPPAPTCSYDPVEGVSVDPELIDAPAKRTRAIEAQIDYLKNKLESARLKAKQKGRDIGGSLPIRFYDPVEGVSVALESNTGNSTFLGCGAAADVWLIEPPPDQGRPQKYVCKTLRVGPECFQGRPPNYGKNDDVGKFQEEFIREFRLKITQWSSLRHLNLVQVFGPGENVDIHVEFCANGTARQYLTVHNETSAIKKKMISNFLEGVEYLHNMTPPMVHGCLKMGKLFVSETGVFKIGEFGLSALTRTFGLLAPSIDYTGLSRWMSPELVNFDPEMSSPMPTTGSDVWASGCTIYEIVTGELPYSKHKHELRVRKEIMGGGLPGYQSPDSNQEFSYIWPVLESCWQSSPDLRPPVSSIRNLAGPENHYLDNQSQIGGSSENQPLTKFTRRPKRKYFWNFTETEDYLYHAATWHQRASGGYAIEFTCVTVSGGGSHEPEWKAIPNIFGEPNPQYAGYGKSKRLAKSASAQMILESGHC